MLEATRAFLGFRSVRAIDALGLHIHDGELVVLTGSSESAAHSQFIFVR